MKETLKAFNSDPQKKYHIQMAHWQNSRRDIKKVFGVLRAHIFSIKKVWRSTSKQRESNYSCWQANCWLLFSYCFFPHLNALIRGDKNG